MSEVATAMAVLDAAIHDLRMKHRQAMDVYRSYQEHRDLARYGSEIVEVMGQDWEPSEEWKDAASLVPVMLEIMQERRDGRDS